MNTANKFSIKQQLSPPQQQQQQQQQQHQHQHQQQYHVKPITKHSVLNSNTYSNSNNNNNNNNNNSNNNHHHHNNSSSNTTVKFIDFHTTEKIDEREKYLTAKYPNHQMALIKKRLKVEFWIDDRLKYLYNIDGNDSNEDYQICPDDLVDSLLDIETDNERKFYILNQLTNAKRSKEQIMQFADELLTKLRML